MLRASKLQTHSLTNFSYPNRQPVHTLDSLVSQSPSKKGEKRRSTSLFHAFRTRRQLQLPLKENQCQDKFTWMPCTLEWARHVSKSHMRHKISTMPGISTTCSSLLRQSWQPYQRQLQSWRVNYQITTCAGRLLNKQLTAVQNPNRIPILNNIFRSHVIRQSATIFQIMNMSKTSTTTSKNRGSLKMPWTCS